LRHTPVTEILTVGSKGRGQIDKIDKETDLVVIGSGGSGLAAAVTAAEEGGNATAGAYGDSYSFKYSSGISAALPSHPVESPESMP
jgi:succinate dehydrogenase/fumarate reductase flavoprotein subunit